jgi:TatD DNase family protein
MLIDTHCHLTFDDLAPQTEAVLARAAAAGVTRVLTVATDVADARAAVALMKNRPNVYLVAGIHPHEAAKVTEADLDALRELHRGRWGGEVDMRRLVAVGEIGLDFHYDFATPEQQERLFRAMLELAREVGRPVVIHARRAEENVCDILDDYPELAGRVAFHCFSGDSAIARRILDKGNFLSFTGVVTFKNSTEMRAVARLIPADRILVETDAPFLTPEPIRKVRPCEPAHVVHTARFIADLRGEPFDRFAGATTRTAERFFGLPGE